MNTALHLPLSPAVLSSSTKLTLQTTDTLAHNTQLSCAVIIAALNRVASNYIHCTSLIAGSRERTCTRVPATAFCSGSSVHCTVHTTCASIPTTALSSDPLVHSTVHTICGCIPTTAFSSESSTRCASSKEEHNFMLDIKKTQGYKMILAVSNNYIYTYIQSFYNRS